MPTSTSPTDGSLVTAGPGSGSGNGSGNGNPVGLRFGDSRSSS